MDKILIITRKELKQFFDSLMAYILLVGFLGFSGFFTWLFGSDIFLVGQASLQTFFAIAFWTLFFFIPSLTMRMIAEERKSGTIETLLTKPISDWQVIIGKFLGTLVLVCIALVLTLPYYFTISSIGKIDHGSVISGYLGLILMSGVYISIGLYASSISCNQIVGFLLALLIGMFFHIIFDVISTGFTGLPGEVFSYLSMATHFESISRGVIDSKDLIYFFSLIVLGLVLTHRNLARSRS
ncbi:MAG: ABC transporter permease subunit [Bacteroidetes bacterium]|nr:ABC transporter permease subunit [Bacteroidota bacterium]